MSKAPKHRGTTTRTMPMGRAPRGPNGERLCRWCHGPVAPPRRTFCSEECVHEWRIRRDSGYVRKQVFRRDQGVCAICGLDTVAALRMVHQLWRQAADDVPWGDYRGQPDEHWEARQLRFSQLLEASALPPDPPRHRKTLWDADHIVPVVEGGGICGLDNYRTLCIWCHRQETAKLAARRSRERRPQQELSFDKEAEVKQAMQHLEDTRGGA